jgi:hypothetical protein
MAPSDLENSAAAPRQITIDGNTTSEHSLADQIAATKFVMATRARRFRGFGISIAKLRPHGAVFSSRREAGIREDGY